MLDKIMTRLKREFWYYRGESLCQQLFMLDDLIQNNPNGLFTDWLKDRQFKVAERLENADQNFWYWAARD